jgi:hypothetical protein
MRHVNFAIAFLCMLLVVPQMTRAGQITYNIQDYPADQVDGSGVTHHVSGTITTDGTIGTLTVSDILSWVVTFDGTDTYRSTDPLALPPRVSGLEASSVNLTVPSGEYFDMLTSSPLGANQLAWYNNVSYNVYQANFYNVLLWYDRPSPSSLGGNPYVIAVAQSTAVPEPSSLAIAGLASVCGIAYGLARKRRAQRKPRNEP